MNKVLENSVPEPNTGCFIWLGPIGSRGYGNTKFNGKIAALCVAKHAREVAR